MAPQPVQKVRGLGVGVLVHVVVQQVLVLREKVGRAGGVVVGAEAGLEGGVGLEGFGGAAQGVGRQRHIRVDKEHIVAVGQAGAGIPSHGRPMPAGRGQPQHARACGLRQGGAVIGRAIVDDDQLGLDQGAAGVARRR